MHSRSVGCARGVDGTNSNWNTHVARTNSWGTLHSACITSGGHVNSYGCTCHSWGSGWNKASEHGYSVSGAVSCFFTTGAMKIA